MFALFSCITPDVSRRPDIVGVASCIADRVIQHLETERACARQLERKLEKERQRTQRYYDESHRNMQRYHKIRQLSRERYQELENCGSSGGARGVRELHAEHRAELGGGGSGGSASDSSCANSCFKLVGLLL